MISNEQVVIRLIVAALLGAIVGFEREVYGKAAGFRTHILVGLGACLIMLTSIYVFAIYQGTAISDPARIAAGVVTGIGFLCAGTILRFGDSVKGLTTAASIWVVAGIGLAVGAGFYLGGFVAAVITLITLFFLSKVERGIIEKKLKR